MKKLLTLGLSLIAAAGAGTASAQSLTGAGASFPYPLYSKMFDVYKNDTGVSVNYQSVGSGSGQKQILARTVDFAGTDAYMSNSQLSSAPGTILHVPTAIGAVVPAFNVPGVNSLVLDGPTLADIYLGKIKTWNDPKIKALNSSANLPGLPITVARRADSSGTTAIFTDYLSQISPEWKSKVGAGKSVPWPVGSAGKGNDGVANLVKTTPGALGYVNLAYANQNKLSKVKMKNRKGRVVSATNDTASAAASGVVIPSDTRVSIVNSNDANAWPITGFTWVVFYQDQNYAGRSFEQGREVKKLLWWMTHDGQKYNSTLDYAPLPKSMMPKVERIIKSMTYGNKAL